MHGRIMLLAAIALSGLMYAPVRGDIPLRAPGEERAFSWVTPYADGVRFLEKPPLLYWVTAVSFKLFGINEFALRLNPMAIAALKQSSKVN